MRQYPWPGNSGAHPANYLKITPEMLELSQSPSREKETANVKPELRPDEPFKQDNPVRPLPESGLSTADHIMRVAFGTFLGWPEPASFMGDADYGPTRWRANPGAVFAAEINREVVGSNFAANWARVRVLLIDDWH